MGEERILKRLFHEEGDLDEQKLEDLEDSGKEGTGCTGRYVEYSYWKMVGEGIVCRTE